MKKIIYIGQFTDASGYGSAARKYIHLLDKYLDFSNYELKLYNSSYEGKSSISDEDLQLLKKYELKNEQLENYIKNNNYIAIFHLLPWDTFLKQEDRYKNKLIYNFAKKRINISYWETDKLPKSWIEIFNNNSYDLVVTACEWNNSVYKKSIKTPVVTIPVPVSVKQIENNNKTEEFTIFSLSQWQPRKGFQDLIKAFYLEFYNNADVKLFIKTYRNEALNLNFQKEKENIFIEAKSFKDAVKHYNFEPKCKLEIKTGIVSEGELLNFYKNSNIFCLASKGEGFSIPIAEASLYGLPVIAPNLGGHIDLLPKENNFLYNSFFSPIENLNNEYLYSSLEMNFINSDLNSLRSKLRMTYEMWKRDKNSLNVIGQEFKLFTEKYLNEKNIFDSFLLEVFK